MRGATVSGLVYNVATNISIHAPREGSDDNPFTFSTDIVISIHAPREGSDIPSCLVKVHQRISIHAPREGSDACVPCPVRDDILFQSTLPVRGATIVYSAWIFQPGFQSTLPVRGATCIPLAQKGNIKFQSTLPVRGATFCCPPGCAIYKISIHAPREGSDTTGSVFVTGSVDFNPRSP